MVGKVNKQGFTIIEVVLVLAIAGLIFLMVFVAFPALQRNQRDGQRRQDMLGVVSAVEVYKSNSGGELPGGRKTSECRSWVDQPNASSNSDGIRPNDPSTYGSNEACKFIATYLNSNKSSKNEFADPDGELYGLIIKRAGITDKPINSDENRSHNVYLYKGVVCSGEGEDKMGVGESGDYAVYYKLESGEFCKDNK